MNNRPTGIAVQVFFLVTLLAAVTVACSPKEDTADSTKDDEMPVHWSYMGVEGPDHWGMLDEQYMQCETGREQSPINIRPRDKADPASELVFRYQPSPVHVVNNGHTVQVDYKAGSTLLFNGKTYKLRQLHFHGPSEHHVQGKAYPMEMHLVHQDDAGHVLVVGALIRIGAEHPPLARAGKWVEQRLGHRVPWEGEEVHSGLVINARDFLPKNTSEYYTYHGSLTTPPCTEGVQWIVLKERIEVAEKQVQRFVRIVGHNARPIQLPH